jgi:transcriptional regulator with XRE-family HTH domain
MSRVTRQGRQGYKGAPSLPGVHNVTTIGSRLRMARVNAGLSQGELAVACGWGKNPIEGQSRVSNYERNAREMTLEDLIKMCKVLKANPAEVAFGHPLKPDPIEQRIIDDYRNSDDRGKKYILTACEANRPESKPRLRSVRTNEKL